MVFEYALHGAHSEDSSGTLEQFEPAEFTQTMRP